jgi:hypothetical protein
MLVHVMSTATHDSFNRVDTGLIRYNFPDQDEIVI